MEFVCFHTMWLSSVFSTVTNVTSLSVFADIQDRFAAIIAYTLDEKLFIVSLVN